MGADVGRSGAGDDRPAAESEPPRYLVERGDRRDASRRRVEKIALSMFAEHGFGEVTVTEICARAQVAPATFYRYFGSKEGVIFLYEQEFLAIGRGIGTSVDPKPPRSTRSARCWNAARRSSKGRARSGCCATRSSWRTRPSYGGLSPSSASSRIAATGLASARQENEPTVGTLLDAAVCMAVKTRPDSVAVHAGCFAGRISARSTTP